MTTITSQQARDTKIFVIENEEVVETTLFDHVCESAKETTSPRGVMHKMFVQEVMGVIYRELGTQNSIDEIEYDALPEEEQENYNYLGEAPIRWELREWAPNGTSRLIDIYTSQEDADNEWFDRTYKFDFLTDDQRDTMYWHTEMEAYTELEERQNQ